LFSAGPTRKNALIRRPTWLNRVSAVIALEVIYCLIAGQSSTRADWKADLAF
jgi:hypothetical protein